MPVREWVGNCHVWYTSRCLTFALVSGLSADTVNELTEFTGNTSLFIGVSLCLRFQCPLSHLRDVNIRFTKEWEHRQSLSQCAFAVSSTNGYFFFQSEFNTYFPMFIMFTLFVVQLETNEQRSFHYVLNTLASILERETITTGNQADSSQVTSYRE